MKELLTTKEIADLFCFSRAYVTDKVVKRPDFPKPEIKLNRKTRKWRADEVEAWRKRNSEA